MDYNAILKLMLGAVETAAGFGAIPKFKIHGQTIDLNPTVVALDKADDDGKVSADEVILALMPLTMQLQAAQAAAHAVSAVLTPAAPTTVTVPAPTPITPAKLRIVKLEARLTGIFDRNNQPVTPDPLPGVLRGDNWDNGFNGHSDCTPILEDGTRLVTGDPRWKQVNRWDPNGNAIFPYYEYNGQLTDIRQGDHGSEFVEPTSFEDDEGCTVTWKVDTAPPHRDQANFRFGYMHKNEDGSWVDSGLIGQGNQPGGEPFKIK